MPGSEAEAGEGAEGAGRHQPAHPGGAKQAGREGGGRGAEVTVAGVWWCVVQLQESFEELVVSLKAEARDLQLAHDQELRQRDTQVGAVGWEGGDGRGRDIGPSLADCC